MPQQKPLTIDITPDADGLAKWAWAVIAYDENEKNVQVARDTLHELGIQT